MPLPQEYINLSEKIAEQKRLNQERLQRIRENQKIQENKVFNDLVNALMDYDYADIDGHKITIAQDNVKDSHVIFFCVDYIKWLEFRVSGKDHYCHCENACDCFPTYSVQMEVKQYRKSQVQWCYFSCSIDDFNNKDEFAKAIYQMMEDYRFDT
jgi:hypothetical protein